MTGPKGAIAELFKMKEEGFADAVGLAAGRVDIMMPMLRDWDFDALITHNRFTLANRNAEEMIDLASEKGIAVLNAAPYAGGVLAKGSASYQRYVYQEASDEDARSDPPHRGDLREAQDSARRGGAAILHARSARRLDDLRRHQAGARARDARMGGVANSERGVGRACWRFPSALDDPEATRDYKLG